MFEANLASPSEQAPDALANSEVTELRFRLRSVERERDALRLQFELGHLKISVMQKALEQARRLILSRLGDPFEYVEQQCEVVRRSAGSNEITSAN